MSIEAKVMPKTMPTYLLRSPVSIFSATQFMARRSLEPGFCESSRRTYGVNTPILQENGREVSSFVGCVEALRHAPPAPAGPSHSGAFRRASTHPTPGYGVCTSPSGSGTAALGPGNGERHESTLLARYGRRPL